MAAMKSILYFQSPAKTFAPEKFVGIREIMDKKGIFIQTIEEPPTRLLIRHLKEFWQPLGAIVDCGREYNDIDTGVFAEIPTVFMGHNPATIPGECLHVMHDQAQTARLAARELMETGFDRFAFVAYTEKRAWSDEREAAFRSAIEMNGRKCAVHKPSGDAGTVRMMNGLRRFLESLEKPCAVFAANDKMAEAVLSSARLAGLAVPDSLAVIGVDNYIPICEHTTPPLTSIEPDFRRGGSLAALMLLALSLSKGDWEGPRTQTFGPKGVVRRASSRLLLRQDPQILAALDLIRREACSGLTAADVAKTIPCSRRMADRRFERATGHTILDEIHAVQLERAKVLLGNENMPLKAISDFCGFTHPNSLRKFFLKATGMTMSAYRVRSGARRTVTGDRKP